jgi:hypothetical protein
MSAPDLKALQTGDSTAWDAAFSWVWPTVFAVAHENKMGELQSSCPHDPPEY